jgi:hypothetical protein
VIFKSACPVIHGTAKKNATLPMNNQRNWGMAKTANVSFLGNADLAVVC